MSQVKHNVRDKSSPRDRREVGLRDGSCRGEGGTREISSVSGKHTGPAHEGNSRTMGMHADEKSDGCIVPVKPRTMPSDIGGGDGGGTAAGQGEGELQRM